MNKIDLSTLSDSDLKSYKSNLEFEIKRLKMNQETRKIQINSAYGCMGNAYYRWYDIRLAEAVTLTGQFIIRTIISEVNKNLNALCDTKDHRFIISAATDSIYVKLGPIVDKFYKGDKTDTDKVIEFIDQVCETMIQPIIQKASDKISDHLNFYSNEIKMKRETISKKGIWVGVNRYCLDIYVSEATKYTDPEIQVKGIEAVRSSTPKICKDSLKKGIAITLRSTEQDFQKHISDFKSKFYSSGPSDVAMTISANNLDKYTNRAKGGKPYISRTPASTKAAILYNSFLIENNLEAKYESIKESDKIKMVYISLPNKLQDDIIGYTTVLPDEMMPLNINYDRQFKSVYLSILERLAKVIGWETERTANLGDLF